MNYFKEIKLENKDTCDREQEKPKGTLQEAQEYDKKFVNRILNKPIPTEADKYNIARVIEWYDYWLTLMTKAASGLTKENIGLRMKEFEDRINAKEE